MWINDPNRPTDDLISYSHQPVIDVELFMVTMTNKVNQNVMPLKNAITLGPAMFFDNQRPFLLILYLGRVCTYEIYN